MASVHDLAHQSGFVFEGALEQQNASTSAAFPSRPDTAVVRVTRIIKSTPALAGYTNQLVTVHLQSPAEMKAGDRAVFFTHGVHYGDGMVVSEIGRVGGAAASMETELSSALITGAEADMTQRLAEADLVISGVASNPRPRANLGLAAATGRVVSEHEPDWWTATVTIEHVEKGTRVEKTAEVLFAKSTDIAWARSPKIKDGDHGVWLLHNRDVYGRSVPAPAATHPMDFRPADEISHVRMLLK